MSELRQPAHISGRTTVVAIIGHPIRRVRSPTTVNAELAKRGIDAALVPADLDPSVVPSFLEMLRHRHNSPGCIVTVPHKSVCAGLVDELTERSRQLGAVNLIRRTAEGRLQGAMIDGEGFLSGLRGNGFDPKGKKAIVFGAGAVGRALLLSLMEAGASRVVYSDPDTSRLGELQRLAEAAGIADRLSIGLSRDLREFDLAVDASPVGMGADSRSPFDPTGLAADAMVADVVTDPVETPLLTAARSRGCRVQNGLAMSDAQLYTQLPFLGLGRGRE